MDFATHINVLAMLDDFVALASCRDRVIAFVLIGHDQIDSVGHGLTDKPHHGRAVGILNQLCNYISLAADGANDLELALSTEIHWIAFADMFIFLFAADLRFIDFDYSHQLREIWIGHSCSEPMAHIPSRTSRGLFAKIHITNLARRNAFLALKHRPENPEPRQQGMLGIFEDRSRSYREAVGVALATVFIRALPFPRL